MDPNPLRCYFERNDQHLIHKWMHYFDIYHRHFERFRGKQPAVLEFGVSQGGSLQMWRHYFGEGARIYGVDIKPECRQAEDEDITIFIGDQEDREFLRELAERLGPIDILIDDGGHTMGQQIATFEELYPAVSETGLYLAEDLHTSYWKKYGGELRDPGSFIEYSKRLIDALNAWHMEPGCIGIGPQETAALPVTDFTRSTWSMTYYDSILVIEKKPIQTPFMRKTGYQSFQKAEPGKDSTTVRQKRTEWEND